MQSPNALFTKRRGTSFEEPPRGKRALHEMVLPGGRTIVCISMIDSSDTEQQTFANEAYRTLSSQLLPFAVIMDMRSLTSYPATQREQYAEIREKLRSVYEARRHRLTVYLIDSDLQRGFVTAVGWKASASDTSGRTFVKEWSEAFRLCKEALSA